MQLTQVTKNAVIMQMQCNEALMRTTDINAQNGKAPI